MEALFSIIIPTYGRPEPLRRTIEAIVPQLDKSVCVIIIDNASPTPASEVLRDLLDHYSIKIIRNPVNIGGNANLVKCFEICETEWMWMLGDDDYPASGAVDIIRNSIVDAAAEDVYINYSVTGVCEHDEDLGITNYSAALEKFSNPGVVGNCLCISTGIWRAARYKEHVKLGYHYASTCGPHLVMLMILMKTSGNSMRFTSNRIIERKGYNASDTYSPFIVQLGVYEILDITLLRHPALFTAVATLATVFGDVSRGAMRNIILKAEKYEYRYWFYVFLKLFYFTRSTARYGYLKLALIAVLFRFAPFTKQIFQRNEDSIKAGKTDEYRRT